MTVVGARIDNRLLHGIVATSWAPQSGATRVMVIDNEVANNPSLKNAMKLGRPSGMAVSIITKETAVENFKAGKYDDQKIFIISKTPQVFLDLINLGQKIPEINLGGTLSYEDGIKVTNRAYILPTEVRVYKAIERSGVKVVSAYTTNDKPLQVAKVIADREE